MGQRSAVVSVFASYLNCSGFDSCRFQIFSLENLYVSDANCRFEVSGQQRPSLLLNWNQTQVTVKWVIRLIHMKTNTSPRVRCSFRNRGLPLGVWPEKAEESFKWVCESKKPVSLPRRCFAFERNRCLGVFFSPKASKCLKRSKREFHLRVILWSSSSLHFIWNSRQLKRRGEASNKTRSE